MAAGDEVVITPYRDGPLLVRGPFRMVDQDGREIAVDRGTVALCRCGKSRTRPFCDGSHQVVRFRAPSGLEDGRERRFERGEQGALPAAPAAEQMAGPQPLDEHEGAGAPQDLR